jgi:DNA-binding PadR family transcriptional regulator
LSLKHVVLGFLVDREMHGYELKRALSPALPPERMLNDGVLYPLLKRLETDGLVRRRVERGSGSPDRHVYRPTARGRKVFRDWLRSDALEDDEVAYDFLLGHPFLAKSLFFSRLERSQVRAKLAAQHESSGKKLRTFERIREGMLERGVDSFRIAVLDLGIAQQREKLRWLERMIGELESRQSKSKRRAA